MKMITLYIYTAHLFQSVDFLLFPVLQEVYYFHHSVEQFRVLPRLSLCLHFPMSYLGLNE